MIKKRNIPNLFIIGAPKCGTTSIIHYLNQHPEIFVSAIKEPHFFNTDSGHRYYHSLDKYLELFRKASQKHSYCCEGSVWYLYSDVAVDEILKFNPESKFIVMLRNPVSMFFSLHRELLFGASENVHSALRAWNLQEERSTGKNIPQGCNEPKKLQYGEVCKLGKQVQKIYDKIPNENLKVVFLEELKTESDKIFNEVLDFLDLTSLTLKSYDVINKKKTRKSPVLSKFFIFTTSIKKKLGIKSGLGIASAINKYNVSHDVSIDNDEYKLLTPMLLEYFNKDIALLETVINKDLSHWKSYLK